MALNLTWSNFLRTRIQNNNSIHLFTLHYVKTYSPHSFNNIFECERSNRSEEAALPLLHGPSNYPCELPFQYINAPPFCKSVSLNVIARYENKVLLSIKFKYRELQVRYRMQMGHKRGEAVEDPEGNTLTLSHGSCAPSRPITPCFSKAARGQSKNASSSRRASDMR